MIDSNTFQHLNLNDQSTHAQTNTGQVDMFSQGMYTPYQMTGQYPTTQTSSTPIHQYHFHPYNSNPRDCKSSLSSSFIFHTLPFAPLRSYLCYCSLPLALYPRFARARIADDRCQRHAKPIPNLPHPTNVTPPIHLPNFIPAPLTQPSLPPSSR